MSANRNVTSPGQRRKVLMVAANPSTVTGWPSASGGPSSEAGKLTALVCHGTCLLLETRLSTGDLLVKGETWTGFATSEERHADSVVGTRIQPFWIEDEARKIDGTNFVVDHPFREFAVRDGLLVTGQPQYSGAAVARLVLEAAGL